MVRRGGGSPEPGKGSRAHDFQPRRIINREKLLADTGIVACGAVLVGRELAGSLPDEALARLRVSVEISDGT